MSDDQHATQNTDTGTRPHVDEFATGQLIEATVDNVAHGGICVARHDGRAVFVSDTAPGERILARVTEVKKRFARAETLRVIEAHEERREHVWPEASIERDPADRAGGAEFGHLTLSYQRKLKRRVLVDAFARFAKLDIADGVTDIEACPGDDELQGTRWRTRVTLHVDEHGNVGPYAARSRRVIPVTSLPLAVPDLEELAPLDGVALGESGRYELVQPSELDARIRFVPATRRGANPVRNERVITETVNDRSFQLAEDSFWQVHRQAATTLFNAVKDAAREHFAPEAHHLDLYGGVGLLAAALGELGGTRTRVESVEAVESATEHAQENLAEWVGSRATTARVDHHLARVRADRGDGSLRGGTVVLDPPRAGAGLDVIESLDALDPRQLIYVACDPVALARDTAYLTERGWSLTHLRAFDLFPSTHHMETLARFERG
ncbi:class I SAM-dependent RNA methyltransferase [Pseudoclavibacter alba]|uniref:class I SAM-dependent RNA methyltransferase n=1 Tax=Pseudoclavibacter albus TaxID=272241 RepID=UPI0019D18E91|nr:TRAM domain-containing protein [Pseudoclavibacter alba]MBN6778313.1 class I SAM-dependent RNA methyltransferase [Pseudoclavibacter alba]